MVASGDGLMSQVLAHGSYRVTAEDRARLGPHRVRHQVWLLAVHRESRAAFLGRPAADSVVFAAEEPAAGAVEGWFHVRLAEAAGVPAKLAGLYDVSAILGPFLSRPVTVTLRSG
jgi:hypothetical protein